MLKGNPQQRVIPASGSTDRKNRLELFEGMAFSLPFCLSPKDARN